jgi:hypothetical protein
MTEQRNLSRGLIVLVGIKFFELKFTSIKLDPRHMLTRIFSAVREGSHSRN